MKAVLGEGEPYDEQGQAPPIGRVLAEQLKTDEDLAILLTIAKDTSRYHELVEAHPFSLIRAAAGRPNSTAA